jgi:RNA polymerase sigma factor (sigma-70 family)
MPREKQTSDNSKLAQLMSSYSGGHNEAGDQLCASLEPSLRRVADGFLGAGDLDRDDLVQEALLAMLRYLRRGGPLPENPQAFASTIIRNRCRDLYRWRKSRPTSDMESLEHWYASPDRSPLDLMLDGEVLAGLQAALDNLDDSCSQLLRGFYLERRSMEQIRHQLGLTTVQAVYYRRDQCLKNLKNLFKKLGFAGPDERRNQRNQ